MNVLHFSITAMNCINSITRDNVVFQRQQRVVKDTMSLPPSPSPAMAAAPTHSRVLQR